MNFVNLWNGKNSEYIWTLQYSVNILTKNLSSLLYRFLNGFFDGEFIVLLSTMTDEELEFAPERIKKLIEKLDESYTEFLKDTDEAVNLATEYIDEKFVGATSYADCLHIALATIYQTDLLVSWNFKHIVNIERIRGYNSINLKNGYKQLEIRLPRDLMSYEN